VPAARKEERKGTPFCSRLFSLCSVTLRFACSQSAEGANDEKKGGPKREAKLLNKIAALQAELEQLRAQRAEPVKASPASPTPRAEPAGEPQLLVPSAAKPGGAGEAEAQIHASWPLLASDSDDIAAMRFLHVALSAAGYYCGEGDETEWLFGEGTLNALLTFQACSGVAETGVTDAATWRALLGDVACAAVAPFSTAASGASESTAVEAVTAATAGPADVTLRRKRKVGTGKGRAKAAAADSDDDTEGWAGVDAGADAAIAVADAAALAAAPAARWPVLRREDGDARVGALQALLDEAGFACGEDDVRYWFFGDATDAALRTFQACAPGGALPETGVTDAATWRALLGAKRFASGPAVLAALVDAGDDMVARTGVYLIGEDRWEVPERVARKGK
jgi:hypothetical protein